MAKSEDFTGEFQTVFGIMVSALDEMRRRALDSDEYYINNNGDVTFDNTVVDALTNIQRAFMFYRYETEQNKTAMNALYRYVMDATGIDESDYSGVRINIELKSDSPSVDEDLDNACHGFLSTTINAVESMKSICNEITDEEKLGRFQQVCGDAANALSKVATMIRDELEEELGVKENGDNVA